MKSKGNFKAKPINKKIFKEKQIIGIPRVERMPATQFEEFKLSNIKKQKTTLTTEEKFLKEQKEFKALELNRSIFKVP